MKQLFTTSAIFLLFLIASPLCVGRTLLNINFHHGQWQELLPGGSAKNASIDNGLLELKAGGHVATQTFLYFPGDQIHIHVRMKSANIKPAKGKSWRVARVVLVGQNATGKTIGHADVGQLRDTHGWQTFNLTHQFANSTRHFYVRLVQQGKSGQAWFTGFQIQITNAKTTDLIGDSSFEGTLGVDHWYPLKNNKDWDGLETWGKQGQMIRDSHDAVAGNYSAELSGTATLVSHPFPYDGQQLILSGWLRTKNVTQGVKRWAKAGVQLVGLNAQGKAVVHRDLKISSGTQPWKHYQITARFPAVVKQVQVWLRKFQGAGGQVWFDQIRLRQLVVDQTRLPFNQNHATVTIDVKNPGGVINHQVWSGVDVSYASRLFNPKVQKALKMLHKSGFDLLRLHETSNGFDVYRKNNSQGQPVYNWKKFDKGFDLVLSDGFTPIVTLATTPPALARPGTGKHRYTNRYPPKNFQLWKQYIEAFLEHAVQRYGVKEVSKWYWELWNEPDTSYYYKGSLKDFVQLSQMTYQAAANVNKKYHMHLRMGLTSKANGSSTAYDVAVLNMLAKQHQLNLVRHLSFHFYGGVRSPINLFNHSMKEYRGLIQKYPQLGSIEIGCTEWNCNSMNGPVHNTTWDAAFAVKMIQMMLDDHLSYSTFFCAIEYPYNPPLATFRGANGMITGNLIPKPVYNSFVFLNQLRGGKRLKLTSTNRPIDGLAVQMPNGAIRLVLTSYDEDRTRHPYHTKTTISFKPANPDEHYRITQLWAIDRHHGNSYGKWIKLGKPAWNDQTANEKIRKASAFGKLAPPPVKQSNGVIQFTLNIPSPGVRMVELAREK